MKVSLTSRIPIDGLLVAIIVLCGYLVTGSSDLRHNGDTMLRYQTTQAIVDHGRIWLSDPASRDTRVALGRGGHLYAFYAPGQTVLMIPLYLVGKVLAHHLGLPYDITTLYSTHTLDLILGALLAFLFYVLCIAVGYSQRVATWLTLLFTFATAAWPDAQSGLEQTQVNVCVLFAVLCCLLARSSSSSRLAWVFLAGTAAGLGFFTRYDAALYVPIALCYVLTTSPSAHHSAAKLAREILAFIMGVAPWVMGVALWNVARFQSPVRTGLSEQTFGEPFLSGLGGLLVSPGKGLIFYVPLIVLLPFSLPAFYRKHPSFTRLFCVLIAVPVVFYSNVLYWHGDPAWGPRYLYTALPYAVLPIGELLSRWSGLRVTVRYAVALLALLSVGINIAAVSVTQWRFWYRLQETLQLQSNSDAWSGHPFHWGASHYHYYWNINQSPILVGVDDLYQVARLQLLGEQRYALTGHPDPYTFTSPADNYPLNTLAFWWADTRHPLLGTRTRYSIAIALGLLGLLSAFLLTARLGGKREQEPARFGRVSAGVGR